MKIDPIAETAWKIETSRPLAVFHALQRDARFLNLHPAYRSVIVEFDPLVTDAEALLRELQALVIDDKNNEERLVKIPVVYDGPDLQSVAEHHGITVEEVVRRHSEPTYEVAFLGFQPGFPYLLGLPKSLATPRLETPRLRVPAGSVGIAGEQTGIYPIASPGGWRLIGRARVELFLPHQDPPTLLQPGDRVRFVSEAT